MLVGGYFNQWLPLIIYKGVKHLKNRKAQTFPNTR